MQGRGGQRQGHHGSRGSDVGQAARQAAGFALVSFPSAGLPSLHRSASQGPKRGPDESVMRREVHINARGYTTGDEPRAAARKRSIHGDGDPLRMCQQDQVMRVPSGVRSQGQGRHK